MSDNIDSSASSTANAPYATVRCEKCGKNIPEMSMVVHDAKCRGSCHTGSTNTTTNDVPLQPTVQPLEENEATETESSMQARGETCNNNPQEEGRSTTTVENPQEEERSITTIQPSAPLEAEQEQQWPCPRCTLLNPNTSLQCDACNYLNTSLINNNQSNQSNNSPPQQRPLNVEVREVDPRMVGAVGSMTTVLSFSAIGGLFGGPVGALLGGAAGVVVDGITRVNNRRAEQNGTRRGPRITFQSTRIVQTPGGGSTVSVTNNAGGRIRTVTIRPGEGATAVDLSNLSPIDRSIVQMLLLNALSQGAQNTENMSYEELLQRFGVGTENRGASQEAISALPLKNLDRQALDELNENQKTCNVCLEDFQEGDSIRKLHCSHGFHKECIDRWLAHVASCPLCKKEIPTTAADSQRR